MAQAVKVLDSWAFLAFFENEPQAEAVEQILLSALESGAALLMSVINLGEVWYSVARTRSPAEADTIIGQIFSLGVEVVSADWDLTRRAAQFKARGGIAYAHCFAAALADIRHGELVTGDTELRQLENEISIHWL